MRIWAQHSASQEQLASGDTMTVTRIEEAPRVTKPLPESSWEIIQELGASVERDLQAQDVRLTMGGELERIELSGVEPSIETPNADLLALDEALAKLEQKDARKAKLVKLRFFAGLSNQEAAALLGIAASTADLDWAYAKTWLRIEMATN